MNVRAGFGWVVLTVAVTLPGPAPQTALSQPAAQPAAPTRAGILRGEYGRYRANNDLLFYHLDVRVDPERKYISGKNTIRFRMLEDDARIQIDLSHMTLSGFAAPLATSD